MAEQKAPGDWEEVYDKSVGTLVRECLTILEGLISSYQKESLFIHTEQKIAAVRKKIKLLFLIFLLVMLY